MDETLGRSEGERPENTELLDLVIESARDFAIFTLDLDRRIVTWNIGARRLTGFEEGDVVGGFMDVIFTPEDREKGAPALEASTALAEGRAEDQRWHFRKDGTRFWGSGQLFLLRDGSGTPRGFAKILRDMTEQKRDERRLNAALRDLEASEMRSRLLVSEVRDYAIFMIDVKGVVLTWNAGGQRLLGYAAEEIIGLSFERLFTEPDLRAGVPAEEMREAVEVGRAEREAWRVKKDGSLFWGNEVITALRNSPDEEVCGFTKITRDLSERKQAEDALRRAHDELEARVQERTAELSLALASLEAESAERAFHERARQELLRRLVTIQEDERRRIARELHDEMGQHLTAMSLELKLLRDSIPEDHPARVRLERLQEVTGQTGREIHRLALELRPTALDDLGLLTTLANYLDDWSQRTGIKVDYHAVGLDEERPPLHVETTVYRIVQEALTNVARHAAASRVGVVLERRPPSLNLIVEDDGRGFDAEAVLRSADAGGRLGILGMKERVAMVGGSLTVESQPGSPTTIFVRIPAFELGRKAHG